MRGSQPGLRQTEIVDSALLIVGAVLTLVGAGLLIVAFQHGRAGRSAAERRAFRLGVAGMAFGSLCLLAGVVVGT